MTQDKDQLTPMTLRKRVKGLTQRKVAQALDIREATVSEWERGISTPRLPLSKVRVMMAIYECTLDELIEAFESPVANFNN